MPGFPQLGWGRRASEVGIDPILSLPGLEDVQAALEALGIAVAATTPIDSGAVSGSPQFLVVSGGLGQLYYDRPNLNWYVCNAAGGGATWDLVI